MVKRILEKLFLTKIAAVDKPCQEHATMTILKRDPGAAGDDMRKRMWESCDDTAYEDIRKRKFTQAERDEAESNGHAMPGGRYPINDKKDLEDAIHAVGRGKGSHAAIRAHIKARAKALGASDMIPDTWKFAPVIKALRADLVKFGLTPDADDGAEGFDQLMDEQALSQQIWDCYYKATEALRQSICSILKDDSVTDKAAMIEQSLKEFSDYVQEQIPGDVGKSLAGRFMASIAGSAGNTLNKGVPMSDALKKALGLSATATEADIVKAAEQLKDEKDKAEKRAANLAKMSDKHKAYMDHKDATMPSGGKEAFADMSSEDRDAHMSKHPVEKAAPDIEKALQAGDAFKSIDGQVFMKRDFGTERAFEFAKAQNAERIKDRAEMAKRDEEAAVSLFAKRSTDLGFGADFGPTLRKAYQGDTAAQGDLEKRIVALQKQVEEGQLFSSFGKNATKPGSAEGEFMAKVDEIKKANPKLSDQQAYAKAYKDPANADIRKRMQVEAAS